jgi:hypothetical protein
MNEVFCLYNHYVFFKLAGCAEERSTSRIFYYFLLANIYAWLNFLDQSLPIKSFNSDIGWLLTDALYSQADNSHYLAPLFNLCEAWLNAQKEPKT